MNCDGAADGRLLVAFTLNNINWKVTISSANSVVLNSVSTCVIYYALNSITLNNLFEIVSVIHQLYISETTDVVTCYQQSCEARAPILSLR